MEQNVCICCFGISVYLSVIRMTPTNVMLLSLLNDFIISLCSFVYLFDLSKYVYIHKFRQNYHVCSNIDGQPLCHMTHGLQSQCQQNLGTYFNTRNDFEITFFNSTGNELA